MTITQVRRQDVKMLKDIARRAILTSVEAEEAIKKEIIHDTDKHIEKNVGTAGCIFLKYGDNPPTGFILVQDFWNLSDLFVAPEKHGEGIGSKLLKKAISACANTNEKGYIGVNSSINAEGFYRKYGFDSFTLEKEMPDFVVPLIYRF